MKLDKAETQKTFIQLLKYGIIGVSNTLITLATFYILNTLLSVPYTPANVVGYVLGVANSFIWNRTWVFKAKDNVEREALLFVIGFGLCWLLQMVVSVIMLEAMDMKNFELSWLPKAGQNITMVVAMVFYTIANYIYNRFVTFKEKNAKSGHGAKKM